MKKEFTIRMNRRALEPITAIILVVALIAGFFIAKEIGLFSVFSPPTPDTNLESIVNKYYYGPATSNPIYSCDLRQQVLVRATFDISLTATAIPGSGSQIAVDLGGITLDGYQYSSSGTTGPSTGNIDCTTKGTIIYDLGTLKVVKASQYLYVCKNTASNTIAYAKFVAGGGLSTSKDAQGGFELLSNNPIPIKDSGRFACVNNQIVLQYCGTFGFEVKESCSLGCGFVSSFNIGNNVLVDAVKCNGVYKPNQNLCGSDVQSETNLPRTLYKTDSTGNLNITTCGFACNAGACVQCKEGAKQCLTNTQPQICQNGVWVNEALCFGQSTCAQTGDWPDTGASCESAHPDGYETCTGNQPQIFRTATNSFVNKSYTCTTQCVKIGNTADCVDQCSENSCEAGALFTCNLADSGNTPVQSATCISGLCIDSTNCKPQYQLNKSYCNNNKVYRAIPDATTPANGGVTLGSSPSVDCKVGCTETVVEGVKQGDATCTKLVACIDKENQNICVAGQTTQRATCSAAGDELLNEVDCRTVLSNQNAICSSGTCITPTVVCAGDFACKNGQMYSCSNGQWGSVLNTCNSLGCSSTGETPSSTNSECNNAPAYNGTLNMCSNGNSVLFEEKNVTDADGKQYLLKSSASCGQEGCNPANGLCNTQCTPGSEVCSNGAVYSCSSSGALSENPVYTCNGLQCDTSSSCKSDCSQAQLNNYQCRVAAGGLQNSFLCNYNSTSKQYIYSLSQTCGGEGCDSVTGKCVSSGNPNSFICEDVSTTGLGGLIYSTNSLGQKADLVDDCRNKRIETFDAFCFTNQNGDADNQCHYCIQGVYYCGTNEKFKCSDPLTLSKTDIATCEAGCSSTTSGTICDQLSVIIGKTTFAKDDKNVLITATLTGDISNNPKSGVTYSVTLSGSGLPQSIEQGTTGVNGMITASFGDLPLGAYNVSIALPEYPAAKNQKSFTVRVTNDYIITVFGGQVQFNVPNKQTKIIIQALKGTNAPQGLTITNIPQGLTSATITPTSVSGQWNLNIEGEPGKYTIGISPYDTALLEEQTVDVELRKASLLIESNMPASAKPGVRQYDIYIKGQVDTAGAKDFIKPDSISATIEGESISLSDLGGGRYTFEHDFSSEGTYNLEATASKAGYESATRTLVLQISSSGTVSAPGSGGAGSTGTTGTTGTTTTTGINNNTLIIIIIGVLIGYFVFGRKRR